VGDSFTFGLGVEEDGTFPAALASALAMGDSEAHGSASGDAPGASGASFEVLNGGVPGYNLFQERRWIERLAPALRVDAVVLVLIENDLYNLDGSDLVAAPDGTLVRRPGSYQPDVNVNPFAALSGPWLWLQLNSVAFREASFRAIRARLAVNGDRELAARAAESERARDLSSRLLRGDDDPDTRPRFDRAAIEIRHAVEATRTLAAPLLVVLFPRPEQLFAKRLRDGFERLHAMAISSGALVVDPSEELAAAPDRISLYLFPGDHHPSPRGYALAARTVAPLLRDALERRTGRPAQP
jgi:hypothetical protein